MGIPAELLNLYKSLSGKERFYIKARWLVNPIGLVERSVPERGRIYDIGCGIGLLANLMSLSSSGRQVIGLDLSGEKIAIARRSVGERSNINFEISDIMTARIDRPDAVIACDLLHHIAYPDQERLMSKIYASLGIGGVFILQDIDKASAHKYLFAYAVDMLFNKMKKVFYRTAVEWARLLEKAGFEVSMENLGRGYPVSAVLFRCVKR